MELMINIKVIRFYKKMKFQIGILEFDKETYEETDNIFVDIDYHDTKETVKKKLNDISVFCEHGDPIYVDDIETFELLILLIRSHEVIFKNMDVIELDTPVPK